MPYLVDIIVFSATLEEHIKHIRKVLGRLRDHGVKLKSQKCKLFKREVAFPGRVVSGGGCKLDPYSIKSVLALKDSIPKTVSEVHKLMGFLNYYPRYIRNFSRIAKPIFNLVKAPAESPEEKKKQTSRKDTGQLSPN